MDHVTGDEVIEVEESTGAADSCFECEDQAEVLPSELDGGAASGAAESARAPPGTITDLCNSFTKLMSDSLYNEYDRHERDVRHALERRRAKMAFKVNDTSELLAEHDADAAADADAGLGVWNHGDRWQGDVNLRTLKTLLTRIDQRGFERSSQQLDFHVRHATSHAHTHTSARAVGSMLAFCAQEAFFNACSRVIYKSDWEVHKPEIMRKNNWKTVQSEVMISTPRRFGKTCVNRSWMPPTPGCAAWHRPASSARRFSIAIFCACLALAFGVEIVVFRCMRCHRASQPLTRALVCAARLAVRPESCSRGSSSAAAPRSNHRHPGAARPRAACARAGLSTWPGVRRRFVSITKKRAGSIHSTAESRLCAPFRARLRCGAAC